MPASHYRSSNQRPTKSTSSSCADDAGDCANPMRSDFRALLLDDDPAIGKLVKRILEADGMECVTVTRVTDFFETIDRWTPTHLLLDLMMPGMDGVEVMSSLAKRRCDSCVVLISGIGTQLLDAAWRAANANGLNVTGTVQKPFSAAHLVAAVRRSGPGVSPTGLAEGEAALLAVTEADLDDAIQHNQFHIAYQPKVRCDTGALVGFEALLRWSHPEHGAIPPDAFIPMAERSDRIGTLTRVVLEKAVGWLSRSRHGRATLSVNVSARCLHDSDFTDHVVGLCSHFCVPPAQLVLELTETAATDDPVMALNSLTRLRLRGVSLAIDDFGTGYSSMSQLAQLPFSEIKIDKSFVMSADHSERARSIIQSTIQLGHQLRMTVTAEGVESPFTLELLRDLGCDFAQGYLIARPLDENAARDWRGVPDAIR